MNNNRASRKGIGAERSDYDLVTSTFRSIGLQFGERSATCGRYDPPYPFTGRRRVQVVSFETTSLYFSLKGAYIGREYMARDENDYFTPRFEGKNA